VLTRADVAALRKRLVPGMSVRQRRGWRRLGARERWRWLWRVHRIEAHLDDPKVRGVGVNLRWLDWLGRHSEAFQALERAAAVLLCLLLGCAPAAGMSMPPRCWVPRPDGCTCVRWKKCVLGIAQTWICVPCPPKPAGVRR